MASQQFDKDLTQSVQETGVHEGWVSIFKDDLLSYFNHSISYVEKNLQSCNKPMVPEKSKILLALSRCAPEEVKVVILGHEPIPSKTLATGFAFSFPENEFINENVGRRTLNKYEEGVSVKTLHDVLVDADYLERGATYDCCHEVWADRGVLLLNASLTYSKEREHFPLWEKFVLRLLVLLVQIWSMDQLNRSKHLFILCWGTNAEDISQKLLPMMKIIQRRTLAIQHDQHNTLTDYLAYDQHNTLIDHLPPVIVFVGHHPTYPRDKDDNKFAQQAKIQFQAIRKCYPDLFTLEKHIPTIAPEASSEPDT